MAITTITKVGAFTDDVATQLNANFADLSATSAGGALADGEILVGDAGGASAAVAMSGDATIINDGTVTVVGVNGAAVTADGTAIDAAADLVADITATAAEINDAAAVIAALPTSNVASPAIWNDAGVLKVGTA